MRHFKIGLLVLILGLVAPEGRGQDEQKIQRLFQDAIQAMGGPAYTQATDVVSEGNYFMFNREGDSSGLIKYFDWTKFPDKSHNEIGNNKKARDVTVFNLEKNEGWILEGQKDTRDATPDEMKEFKAAAKHSIDNIFRFRYRDPANKLFYLGTGDGSDVQYEVIKLLDPENDEISILFDRMSKLPAKIEYQSVDKNGIHRRHSDEFSQWHVVQGINTPLRTDSLVNGRQSSQLFLTKVTYNTNMPDSFFSKPMPPK
jgi:hypothetical protein